METVFSVFPLSMLIWLSGFLFDVISIISIIKHRKRIFPMYFCFVVAEEVETDDNADFSGYQNTWIYNRNIIHIGN